MYLFHFMHYLKFFIALEVELQPIELVVNLCPARDGIKVIFKIDVEPKIIF